MRAEGLRAAVLASLVAIAGCDLDVDQNPSPVPDSVQESTGAPDVESQEAATPTCPTCTSHEDCQQQTTSESARCITTDGQLLCAISCSGDAACPPEATCVPSTAWDGEPVTVCSAGSGACPALFDSAPPDSTHRQGDGRTPDRRPGSSGTAGPSASASAAAGCCNLDDPTQNQDTCYPWLRRAGYPEWDEDYIVDETACFAFHAGSGAMKVHVGGWSNELVIDPCYVDPWPNCAFFIPPMMVRYGYSAGSGQVRIDSFDPDPIVVSDTAPPAQYSELDSWSAPPETFFSNFCPQPGVPPDYSLTGVPFEFYPSSAREVGTWTIEVTSVVAWVNWIPEMESYDHLGGPGFEARDWEMCYIPWVAADSQWIEVHVLNDPAVADAITIRVQDFYTDQWEPSDHCQARAMCRLKLLNPRDPDGLSGDAGLGFQWHFESPPTASPGTSYEVYNDDTDELTLAMKGKDNIGTWQVGVDITDDEGEVNPNATTRALEVVGVRPYVGGQGAIGGWLVDPDTGTLDSCVTLLPPVTAALSGYGSCDPDEMAWDPNTGCEPASSGITEYEWQVVAAPAGQTVTVGGQPSIGLGDTVSTTQVEIPVEFGLEDHGAWAFRLKRVKDNDDPPQWGGTTRDNLEPHAVSVLVNAAPVACIDGPDHVYVSPDQGADVLLQDCSYDPDEEVEVEWHSQYQGTFCYASDIGTALHWQVTDRTLGRLLWLTA